jgi:hypothetical protein
MKRAFPRLAAGLVLLAELVAISASPVAAATPKRTWSATLGSNQGVAQLVLYPSYRGSATISVHALAPSRTYAVMIYKGSCATPTALVKLPGVRTNPAGAGSRTTSMSVYQGYAIWATAANGSVAIRVASGSARYCGLLRFAIVTRIQIAKFGIDLPIVGQPPRLFPYCNVAMYAAPLSQPGEAGPTFIYAHARVGMFLPLLTASQVTNGASMLGMVVRIWTSDSRLYTYRIDQVLRHQYSPPPYDVSVERLWIQTSEGPRGTYNKLFLVGHRVFAEPAPYLDSHPAPHIVICS